MDQALISESVKVNGVDVTATLTSGGLLRWPGRCLNVEKEVIGFEIDGNLKMKIKAVLESGAGICCGGSSEALVRTSFTFETLSEDSLSLWTHRLQHYIDSLNRPKRLLIFVNPFGGNRSASEMFVHDVKPLLDDAKIKYTVQETTHQLHAKEVAHTLNLSEYDGIVCVSGDGILVEVVNGLLERKDWETAIRMPLGVVPAGTGNGMVKSLLHSVGEPCTASYATLAIIRGHKRSLDVATISQGELRYFSVLMLAWGLVADIDIESEKYRWMGNARIDFYALQRIFRRRKYNGRILFVPAPGYESFGEPINQEDHVDDEAYSTQKLVAEDVKDRESCYRGPAADIKNLSWKKIDGPFLSVWLHNVPWGSEVTMAAPDAKFSDGYLDLILMKECSTLSLLSVMTEMNSGGHVKSPHVLYLKVKAFVLEPGPRVEDPSKEGIIDVDGEVLARGKGTYKCDEKALMAYDKLQIKVDQGLATLFSPI